MGSEKVFTSPNRCIYCTSLPDYRNKKMYRFRTTSLLTKHENREIDKYFDFFITVPEFCTVVAVQLTCPETKEKKLM